MSPAALAKAAPVGITSPFTVEWEAWQQWLRDRLDPRWRPGEWRPEWWLFVGDASNPRTQVGKCAVLACLNGSQSKTSAMCKPCLTEFEASGQEREAFVASYVPARKTRAGEAPADCLVERDGVRCGRGSTIRGLCVSHYNSWKFQARKPGYELSPGDWARTQALPFPVPPPCAVGGCEVKSYNDGTLVCNYHRRLWILSGGGSVTGRTAAMRAWAVRQPPVLGAFRFSLVPLPPLLRLEIAFGLQKRDELGTTISPLAVREIVAALVESGTSLILRDDQLEGRYAFNNPHSVFRQLVWSVRTAFVEFSGKSPWGDVIDLRAAQLKSPSRSGRRSQPGVADLSLVSQPWLRDLTRRIVEVDPPTNQEFHRLWRAVQAAGKALDRLPGGGQDLARLDARHMKAIVDEIAADRRKDGRPSSSKYCSNLLGQFYGLIDFGRKTGMLDLAPGSFARDPKHRIAEEEPNEDEIGRAIPEYVIRQLDRHLDRLGVNRTYGGLTPEQITAMYRTAYIVLRDSGRRPLEVVSLPREPLEYDGSDVSLLWDNHKGRRLRRRLPIMSETVAAIEAWQKVRPALASPGRSDAYFFPTISNASRFDHMDSGSLSNAIRAWADGIPDLTIDAVGPDGSPLPFDSSLIFPYAFRHSFAQRHADGGTPVDVLRDLMDHDDINTTMGYYRVSLERKRAAVKTLSKQVTDRMGEPTPSTVIGYELRSVAVPFGGCTEPSNVKAGGRACPLRFQCSGCRFYRPDPSYLPAIEDHVNDLRADRETARAIDAADFVIDNLTAEIDSYHEVAETMHKRLAEMPEEQRAEIEMASALLRKVRAGEQHKLLPVTVITRDAR